MDTTRFSPKTALAALLFTATSGFALAEPMLAPIANGGIHTFDAPIVEKYQVFDAPTGARHAGGVMNWWYNDTNRPAGVTKAATIAQIQASQAKWTAACNIHFVYMGEDDAAPFSLVSGNIDGKNVIGWDATGITAPTTGITQVAWDGSNVIVDSEIRLNAAYSATYSPASDLDATLTHEVGHSIGLQHSDVQGQVMSGPPLSTYTGLAALQSDDIAGCVFLYGAPGGSGPGPDTQAPSVPSGLAASVVSTTAINVTWNASTDNVGVVSYKVYINGSFLGTVTSTGAAVSGLGAGTLYSFTVSACDAAGNCSAQSAAVTATTLSADTQPPTVPTGLIAMAVSTTQVNLSWNASTDNVGVTGYNVYQGGMLLGSTSSTSASITGLAASTLYSFTVSACDAAGNCSAQSAPASATTMASSIPPSCAGSQPANDQQTLACPAGQTGAIIQSRSYSCVGTTWTPGVYQTISNTCTSSTGSPTSYQDMWWAGASENGWGLTITQHNDTLFLAWYIYDSTGKPMWVVMPGGNWNSTHTSYSGSLFIPTGSSFSSYDATQFMANGSVGSASVTFTDNATGTLFYNVRGQIGFKSISRLTFGAVNTAPITDYSDLWWGGTAQNGWGVVLTQHYHSIFAAWYTYDANGNTTWYVMPDGTWNGNTFSGALYRTTSSPVIAQAYNASSLVVTQVGTLSLTFSDANTAVMTYTVNGITQTKPITRQPF